MAKSETATLAGGCFWCTEGIFQRLKGVESVVSGYTGGNTEAVQIEFNPSTISFEKLLYVFFKTHDPTSLNQQGYDVGPQYRSGIFFMSDMQKKTAQKVIAEMQKDYSSPIVTTLEPFVKFHIAEDYHQNFYNRNKNYPYCKLVIDPKITKLTKEFSEDLKP